MSAFIGNLNDIKNNYIDLIPISLRYDEEYLIIFALFAKDCEIDLDVLETPDDVIDIEKTSYKFVDSLWQYFNSHKKKADKVDDYYNTILDTLIDYGTALGYLDMYSYLVPDNLADEKAYKVYLIHLIEFYKEDVDKAEVPEDLEDPSKMPLDVLNNIWSYYNYNYRQGSEEDKLSAEYISDIVRGIWEVKREEYLYLVPEYLRTNHGFLVFLSLMIHEFEIAQDNIDKFTDLVDSDKVPLKFLEDLGMYVNYRYIDRAPEDFNRELLLSMHSIWEMRGTDHSIIMAATHGYNPGYVGGDIFIPGYPITNELAELIIGTDRVFIHSRSKFSCIHVYPDGVSYRPGVIIIVIPFINDNIRRKINEVIPAGVKYVFWLFIAAQSDNPEETGIYGEMMYHILVVPLASKGEAKYNENNPINLFISIEPTVNYENYYEVDSFTHSLSPFPSYDREGRCLVQHLLSGQRLFNIIDIIREDELIACALKIPTLKIPFMGESYTGEYIISPSGEYIDTKTTDRPGTSAIRRYFDIDEKEDNLLVLCTEIPTPDPDNNERNDTFIFDSAVSGLPIEIQCQYFAFNKFDTSSISFYDEDVLVGDNFTIPFNLLDEGTRVGTINSNPIYIFDERAFDDDYYYISPSGEYLDTEDKDTDTILRTLVFDYRPEVEIEFIPV